MTLSKKFDYFCSKINFEESALDADAIAYMNDIGLVLRGDETKALGVMGVLDKELRHEMDMIEKKEDFDLDFVLDIENFDKLSNQQAHDLGCRATAFNVLTSISEMMPNIRLRARRGY